VKKLIIGFIVGIIITLLLFWLILPRKMFVVGQSKFGFDETFAKVENNILANNWDIQRIYDISECMEQYGYELQGKMSIISYCKPENVSRVLENTPDRKLMAMMPCRLGIYEDEDGSVFITRMNISMMSYAFGGNVGKILKEVGQDEEKILKEIIIE